MTCAESNCVKTDVQELIKAHTPSHSLPVPCTPGDAVRSEFRTHNVTANQRRSERIPGNCLSSPNARNPAKLWASYTSDMECHSQLSAMLHLAPRCPWQRGRKGRWRLGGCCYPGPHMQASPLLLLPPPLTSPASLHL